MYIYIDSIINGSLYKDLQYYLYMYKLYDSYKIYNNNKQIGWIILIINNTGSEERCKYSFYVTFWQQKIYNIYNFLFFFCCCWKFEIVCVCNIVIYIMKFDPLEWNNSNNDNKVVE